MRHIKREYAKLVTVLQAYALISTGVRMICTNQVSAHGHRQTVMNLQDCVQTVNVSAFLSV